MASGRNDVAQDTEHEFNLAHRLALVYHWFGKESAIRQAKRKIHTSVTVRQYSSSPVLSVRHTPDLQYGCGLTEAQRRISVAQLRNYGLSSNEHK